MADTLQDLITEIPDAIMGEPITVKYHNSLRKAVVKLAEQSGGGPVATQGTYSFLPAFFPITGSGPNGWVLGQGSARLPLADELPQGADRGAAGWVPVQLPDGFKITGMDVRGTLTATSDPDHFDVDLLLQILGSTQTRQLANGSILLAHIQPNTADRFFTPVQTVGTADDLIVKNQQFQYFIRATYPRPKPDEQAAIVAFQIKGSSP